MKNKKKIGIINLILFLPNIGALKWSKSKHKLFLNQSTLPS